MVASIAVVRSQICLSWLFFSRNCAFFDYCSVANFPILAAVQSQLCFLSLLLRDNCAINGGCSVANVPCLALLSCNCSLFDCFSVAIVPFLISVQSQLRLP